MRLHWAFCLLMLVSFVNGQADEASTDELSTASAEQKTTSSDTPSLPSQSNVDTSVKMESPSLPSATDEIDLLAAPEMPKINDGEAITESPKLDSAELSTTLSPKPVDDEPVEKTDEMAAETTPDTPIKEDSEAPISLVKNAAEVIETTPESPKIEEKSAEDAFGQKTSMEASTSEPVKEVEKTETPVSTDLPEQTTDLPSDSKSAETKLSSEAMSTDPFQGNQPQTATEKSKEISNDDEEVGSKNEDTDLKTSAEPLAPVVKEASAEKTEKPTEHSTDPADLELKERPLVPIVHEQSEELTTELPKVEDMSSEVPKVPAHEDEMTKEEAKQEDEKMNQAPKEEGEDGMEMNKATEMMPKSSMEMDKATEMMPKEEGDLILKEDATEAPNQDSSTPIDSHSTSAAKDETAPMEKENSEPAFVPIPSEPVHQSTSHSVASNEATEVTKPVLLETTTAPEAIVESEPKILATNAPIEMIEDDKDDMEKVSKSPAERPQFEEPKMETTKTPDSVGIVEKSEPEMKEPEENQTETPTNIPTAETHLMTSESVEVHQQPSTTAASEQPRETTDATHSSDDEGLFAGDMRNVFAGHHHTESTTQSVDTMTTQKIEQEPKFAEEITETESVPEPTAEPKPEPEPKSNNNEPTAIPEPTAEPHPEPTAEPHPEPTAEPQPEPTAEPEPTQHIHHSHVVHAPENIVTDTMKTPFSLRFTNIDYTDEFKNLNSGAARKLHDQIYDDLSRAFEETLGDNYVGFELLNFRSGSLIVDGRLLSRDELGDPSMVAAKLEDTLQKAGGRLGGNTLDLKSVYVDGIVSKGGAQLDQDGSTTAAANTGYIVGGSIAIGVLIMAFIVFAVIVFGVNARRQKSRTLKLKEELSMAEHGRSPFAGGLNGRNNGQGPVNLMSYGNTTPGQSNANGHSTTTTAAANNSPMLLNSAQFSSPQGFQSN